MKQKVLVIVGPTASGKSALGVKIARKFKGEVISADSRQVYRGLTIGTGKITKREMHGVRHYLLDVASPKKQFSAGDYLRVADKTIRALKHLPIVVGGTGFYIDALLGRISLPEVKPNNKLRKRLQSKTAAQLFALLKKHDPRRARMMNTPSERNNKVRLIRAIEIASARGQVPKKDIVSPSDVLWIGINPPLKVLEQKIKARLRQRIKAGMITEAKRLHHTGLSFKRMEELGLEYRSLARLLQKKITREEFEAELYRDIRRYAKKQLAYWKRNTDIAWFRRPADARIARRVRAWLRAA